MTAAISRSALGELVNVVVDDERYDPLLGRLAVAATVMAENFLDQYFEKAVRTEYFPSRPGFEIGDVQTFWVKAFPILRPNLALAYSPSLSWDTGTLLVEDKNFVLEPERGLIHVYPELIVETVIRHPMGYRLVHESGYEVDANAKPWPVLKDVPGPIVTAVGLQAAFMFNASVRGSMGLDSAGGDNPNSQKSKVTPPSDNLQMIPEARQILKAVQRPPSLIGKRR